MLNDEKIRQLELEKKIGDESNRLLNKYYNLQNELSDISRAKEVCKGIYRLSYNNGYYTQSIENIHMIKENAELMQQILQNEIDYINNELNKLE